MKVLQKLGLSGRFTGVSAQVKGLDQESFEKFGALKYSHYISFGVERELDQTCARYEKHYTQAAAKNKHDLVEGFLGREFENLNEILSENKRLDKSYLATVVQVGKVHLDISRNTTNRAEILKILNGKKDLLNQLCDDDETPVASKINIDRRRFDPIKLGVSRPKIRDEEMPEAVYDPKIRQ